MSTGMRAFHYHDFSRKVGSKAIQAIRLGTSKLENGTHIFHSEIPFENFGLPFKKSRFPRKFSVRGDKINLLFTFHPKFRSVWVDGKQPKKTTTATGTSLNKRLSEQHNGCARA